MLKYDYMYSYPKDASLEYITGTYAQDTRKKNLHTVIIRILHKLKK